MEIKPEDELSNIVLFPVKEDDPRNQVNFLYEPSERPYCHHASVRVDEKERQVRCKICGAVVEPFDWMLSVAKRETRLADDVRLLRQEERERRKNIEKLIQIERNAKARISFRCYSRYARLDNQGQTRQWPGRIVSGTGRHKIAHPQRQRIQYGFGDENHIVV